MCNSCLTFLQDGVPLQCHHLIPWLNCTIITYKLLCQFLYIVAFTIINKIPCAIRANLLDSWLRFLHRGRKNDMAFCIILYNRTQLIILSLQDGWSASIMPSLNTIVALYSQNVHNINYSVTFIYIVGFTILIIMIHHAMRPNLFYSHSKSLPDG